MQRPLLVQVPVGVLRRHVLRLEGVGRLVGRLLPQVAPRRLVVPLPRAVRVRLVMPPCLVLQPLGLPLQQRPGVAERAALRGPHPQRLLGVAIPRGAAALPWLAVSLPAGCLLCEPGGWGRA